MIATSPRYGKKAKCWGFELLAYFCFGVSSSSFLVLGSRGRGGPGVIGGSRRVSLNGGWFWGPKGGGPLGVIGGSRGVSWSGGWF
jgi:hypothetical protein